MILYQAESITHDQVSRHRRKILLHYIFCGAFGLFWYILFISCGDDSWDALWFLIRYCTYATICTWLAIPQSRSQKIVTKIEINANHVRIFYLKRHKEYSVVISNHDLVCKPRRVDEPDSVKLIMYSKSTPTRQFIFEQKHGYGWSNFHLYSILRVVCELGVNEFFSTVYIPRKVRDAVMNDSNLNEQIAELKHLSL